MSPAQEASRRAAGAIRAELARRQLTWAWLAEASGMTADRVGRRLRGETPIDVDELDAWAKALGVSVDTLRG